MIFVVLRELQHTLRAIGANGFATPPTMRPPQLLINTHLFKLIITELAILHVFPLYKFRFEVHRQKRRIQMFKSIF